MFEYNYLTQQQFDLYSGYWKVVVNSANFSLPTCFLDGAAAFVGFSSDQIGSLVSTVGATTIEARFVYSPTTDTTFPNPPLTNFGVVLYAADQSGNRLSAYFLGAATNQFPQANNTDLTMPDSAGDGQGAVQVPHYLVVQWLTNWATACNVEGKGVGVIRQLFTTANGTLEGYSFPLGDLSQALFNAQPLPGVSFYTLLNFGLHQTYVIGNPTQLTYTFGLITRLYDAGGKPLAKGVGSSEPFYDMSVPRPPY